MSSTLHSILLIDDDEATNFLHKMVIKKSGCSENVHVEYNGELAIRYLSTKINGKYPAPDLIFLDLNMPLMNGWGFMEAYQQLDPEMKGKAAIVMLTTPLTPDDVVRSKSFTEIAEFRSKPMTQNMLQDIIAKYFPVSRD